MKARITFRKYSRRAKWVLYPTVVAAGLNFFVCMAISAHLGGDALNGYVRAGHYFLCEHGRCIEVSQAIWHYSYWHALSAMIGILLVFVELAVFINTGDIEWQ